MSETIDLQLTAMGHGGSALGRHEGQVIFVPYAIPGETVRVEIAEAHPAGPGPGWWRCWSPRPTASSPPVPTLAPTGAAAATSSTSTMRPRPSSNRLVVADQLARIGGLPEANVLDIIGAAEPWGYRNHVQFSVTPEGSLGFFTADSHQVVPVKECLILDPLLDDLWAALDMEWPQLHRLSLRCGSATGDRLAIFELDHYQDFDIEVDFPVSCVLLLADGEVVVLMGNPYLTEHVAGRDYRVSAGSFFQVNTGGAEALVALVREGLAPAGTETLLDLYCGVGLFGLALAGEAGRVIGIESDPSAIADFRHNARRPGERGTGRGGGRVSAAHHRRAGGHHRTRSTRSGAGRAVVAAMANLAPRHIAYVSCDPATLARDARGLVKAGYLAPEVQPVDLFPQTFHIESVALFARQD